MPLRVSAHLGDMPAHVRVIGERLHITFRLLGLGAGRPRTSSARCQCRHFCPLLIDLGKTVDLDDALRKEASERDC